MTHIHTAPDYAARRDRLRKLLHDKGLSSFLVTHAADRYYLSGFELHDPQCNESAGMLLVTTAGRDHLLTDSRYLDAGKRHFAEDDIFIYKAPKMEGIRKYLIEHGGSAVGFDPSVMSCAFHEELKEQVPLKAVNSPVAYLRLIKDAEEIEIMRRSCAVNHAVYADIEPMMLPGMTEAELAWEVEKLFREKGASELSFATIAAVGTNAALPHAVPDDTKLRENELVLLDMGGRVDSYCSDQTRTFWVGDKASDRFKRTVDMVREAQDAALQAIRPGLEIKEAHRIAISVFEKYGEEKNFTHALGHGIGLETHERPSLGIHTEGTFQAGMVVTCEPGLYYPDWGGVRWEYMLVVTDEGCEIF
jgi:Xaa-Pro aminopeptidase